MAKNKKKQKVFSIILAISIGAVSGILGALINKPILALILGGFMGLFIGLLYLSTH